MKRIIFFILFITFNLAEICHAESKQIVIITSISESEGKAFWNSNSYSSSKKIEKIFRDNFQGEIDQLRFLHHAKFNDVYRELNSPYNKAIFYIGHGSNGNFQSAAGLSSTLVNEDGVSIQNAFTSFNKNLRFLAIISCYSEKILEETLANAQQSIPQNLKLKLFRDKIEIKKGIRVALADFQKTNYQADDLSETQEEHDMVRIRFQKSDAAENLSTYITIANKTYGVFDKDANETIEIKIKRETILNKRLSLIHHSQIGATKTRLKIGVITLNDDENKFICYLKPELNSKGELLGTSNNYYKLTCLE